MAFAAPLLALGTGAAGAGAGVAAGATAALGGAAAGGGLSIGTLLSGLGTVVGTFGQISANNARARMAEENARRADENAKRTSDQYQEEQRQQDAERAAALGELEAGQAASGLSTLSGSFASVRRRARQLGRLDAQTLRERGQTDIVNIQNQAADFRNEAKDARRGNLFAFLGGATQLGSTLLGGSQSYSPRYRTI